MVAGGGPAGAAAALVLARAGRTVLLADAGRGPAKAGEALHPAAVPLLRDLGAYGHVPGPGHLPCYANVSAWTSDALAANDFIGEPAGHGWNLDRRIFDARLRRAAEAAGARLAEETAVLAPRRQPDGTWEVFLRGPDPSSWRSVRCAWLLDATGRRAAIAGRCGARRSAGHRLVAVCLTLAADGERNGGERNGGERDHCRRDHGERDGGEREYGERGGAERDEGGLDGEERHEGGRDGLVECSSLVEAVPEGWWYTAPLPSGRRFVACFTDADLAPARSPAAVRFLARLAATRHVAQRVRDHSPARDAAPWRTAAFSSFLTRPYGEGWLAAGDAVAAFDPLSAQGILTALYTGKAAGEAVDARLRGDHAALERYRAHLDHVVAVYRRNYRQAYESELRWPDAPFWQRRRHGELV